MGLLQPYATMGGGGGGAWGMMQMHALYPGILRLMNNRKIADLWAPVRKYPYKDFYHV